MNNWLIFLLALLFFILIFFKSTYSHRVGYIAFLLWWIGAYGNPVNKDKINLFLQNHKILSILYKPLFVLLLIYCVIGILKSFVSIFQSEFKPKKYTKEICEQNKPSDSKTEQQVQPSEEKDLLSNAQHPEKPEKKEVIENEEAAPEEVETKVDYLMERIDFFKQRKDFWDSSIEKKVYQILRAFIDEAYIILPHVAFREIFNWEWKKDSRLTDRVTKMHFDFGIYNEDLQPIFFLELHGKNHKTKQGFIERDKFKAEVMKFCEIKLITVDCSEPMTDSEIRDKLIARIKEEIPDRQACATYCPRCRSLGKNNLMDIWLNSKNGTLFYSCRTYVKDGPNCPTKNLENIPPLYRGIPVGKAKTKRNYDKQSVTYSDTKS